MDIDDILREADPDLVTGPHGNRDLQALTRAWVAERSAPELLEYGNSTTRSDVNSGRWVHQR